jgi:hypothetical protein
VSVFFACSSICLRTPATSSESRHERSGDIEASRPPWLRGAHLPPVLHSRGHISADAPYSGRKTKVGLSLHVLPSPVLANQRASCWDSSVPSPLPLCGFPASANPSLKPPSGMASCRLSPSGLVCCGSSQQPLQNPGPIAHPKRLSGDEPSPCAIGAAL